MKRWGLTAALAVVAVLGTLGILRSMGRVWWCKCGTWQIWSGDIWSAHNSQHFLDPYTFSHILHGVVFFGAFKLISKKVPVLTLNWRLLLALVLESAWELSENTEAVIQKYREATISLDYYGDSVLNSGADIVSCFVGFLIAMRLPWWASVGFFVLTELACAYFIRDGLTLNVIMLVYPVEAIKVWQMGG